MKACWCVSPPISEVTCRTVSGSFQDRLTVRSYKRRNISISGDCRAFGVPIDGVEWNRRKVEGLWSLLLVDSSLTDDLLTEDISG